MQDVQEDRRSATSGASEAPSKKHRLALELSQTVNISQIGEKVTDTPIQLSMREVLAVSSEVSSYLHDKTGKRRVPLATDSTVPAAANVASVSSATLDANVNAGYLKQLYACPSGRAKATLDHTVDAHSLLDNGSELNMMRRRIFERTDLPIDTEIRWRIDKYDSKTNAELNEHGPNDVYHEVPVNIAVWKSIDQSSSWNIATTISFSGDLGNPWWELNTLMKTTALILWKSRFRMDTEWSNFAR